MKIVSLFFCLNWTFAFVALWLGTWYSRLRFRAPLPQHPDLNREPLPVSILKPLKGKEPGLLENLEVFFLLDYPTYELLFCVATEEDPACEVVRFLMNRYPNVDANLTVGEVEVGPNPKVNNLVRSYAKAKYEWILISDSNVRVARDYLSRLVSQQEPGIGIITAVVSGGWAKGLGGNLEAIFLNTYYARWMMVASSLGLSFVVGKSMFFRKSVLQRFGGIEVLGRYIAEDYIAGQAIRKLGLRVLIMCDPIPQYIGSHRIGDFWSRHLRWGRIRKAQAPLAFLYEPFQFSVLGGILGAVGVHFLFGVSPILFFLCHMSIWFLVDLFMVKTVRAKITLYTPWAWLIREFIALPLWLHIAVGRTVNWRGNRLRILPGGLLEP